MCAPLGNIDKSGGLLRPEAFSALGDYGVAVEKLRKARTTLLLPRVKMKTKTKAKAKQLAK